MANGLERNVRFSDLAHGDGGLHACRLSGLLEEILQRQAVHHRTEHPHVIAAGTVYARLLKFGAAEEIAAASDDGHLNSLLHCGNDFTGDATDGRSVHADFAIAECLTGEFEQYSARLCQVVFQCHILPSVCCAFAQSLLSTGYPCTQTP